MFSVRLPLGGLPLSVFCFVIEREREIVGDRIMAKNLVLFSWCVMLGILARKQASMESERVSACGKFN